MNRVRYSENLVGEIEGLSRGEWQRLRAHRLFVEFMDEYLTAKCVADFWHFLWYGCYFKARKHYDKDLHRRLANWLQVWERPRHGMLEPVNTKFLIWSRELCKTQTAICWDAWQFVRDVNARGLMRGYTDPKIQEILTGLKGLLQSAHFRRRFPWVQPAQRHNSTQEIMWEKARILLKRDDEAVRVPSLEAAGMETDPTGSHFTFAHYDDFEVREVVVSDVRRGKMFDVWKNDDNLFQAGSRRLFCGTPWSRKGLIYQVAYSKGDYAAHDYDLSLQPCTRKVFGKPFVGSEAVLEGDRVTVRDGTADLPVGLQGQQGRREEGEDLTHCQARVKFFSESVGDLVEEIREVVWNDRQSFRVNRPFPELLGQPVGYVVGNVKPATAVRLTLDAVDWIPTGELADRVIARSSLVQKKKTQGPLVFSAQQDLDPRDSDSMVLNPDYVKVVTAEQVAALEGLKYWYRSVDFASTKKTAAYTAMTTGFWHQSGLYITHMAYENQMANVAKILELLLGVLRVRHAGGELRWTSFEEAAIEQTLNEFLLEAEADPYKFLMDRKERRPRADSRMSYGDYAEKYFKDCGAVRVRRRYLTRGGRTTKGMRIEAQSPTWEAGEVHILEGCPHEEDVRDQAALFTLDSKEPNDLLDNWADLIREGRRPWAGQVEKPTGENMFERNQREAMWETGLAGVGGGRGWGP